MQRIHQDINTFVFLCRKRDNVRQNHIKIQRSCIRWGHSKSLLPPKGFSLRYIISYYQEYKNMGKADKFFTRPQWFDMLVGNRKVRRQITEGKSEEEIRAGWQKELEEYKKMRKKYLIYE